MKKNVITLMLLMLMLLIPVKTQAAEQKQQFITTESGFESKIIGYKYKWKTIKVKKTKKKYLGKFKIVYYCSCRICCGSYSSGVTASGKKAKAGRTIAVDTRVIPMGTKIKISGYKNYRYAEDTGGGIKGQVIDVFCNSHSEALKRGTRTKKVWKVYTVVKKKKVRVKCPITEDSH